MKINTKLTSANQRQEGTIVSLKKELDEVSKKLVQEKMKSVVKETTHIPAGREQRFQELQQKLKMESEMNKKLRGEIVAERVEKQELMMSLQQNQQLLLSQTQTVRRLEQELQTRGQMFQSLKREHEVMREKSKAMEDELVQLKEIHVASRTSWNREKAEFLDRLECERRRLRAAAEACEDLREKAGELSAQAASEMRHAAERENKEDTHSLRVPTGHVSFMVEDSRCQETLDDRTSSSEPPDPDGLQDPESSETKTSDPLQDSDHHQQPQIIKHDPSCPDTFTRRSNNLSSLPDNSGAEPEMEILSDLIVSDESLQRASNPERGSPDESADLELQEEKKSSQEDVKDGGHAPEKCTPTEQTADGIDVLRNTEGSAKATGETSNPATEIRDKGEGEVTDGVKEKEQTAERTTETPETQIAALTAADTTGTSLTLQVNDFTDTDPPRTDCEPSNSSENLRQKVTEGHINKYEIDRKEHEVCDVTGEDSEPTNNQSAPDPELLKRASQTKEGEATQTQTETDNPNIKTADERFDAGVSEESVSESQEVQESVQPRSVVAADDEGDASKRRESKNDTCESARVSETSGSNGAMAAGNAQTDGGVTESEADVKLLSHKNADSSETGSSARHQQLKPMKPGSSGSPLISRKTSGSSFEPGGRANADFSILTQGTHDSGPNTMGRPFNLTATSIKSKQNKVPLVMTGASGVSGAAAYLTSRRQEEVKEETCRGTVLGYEVERRSQRGCRFRF
uniref:Uncharacterized protein n=1 Tax=Kryptolebias marmoratus TaxID=37003 RepID=A0A3Q3A323_KRYMA